MRWLKRVGRLLLKPGLESGPEDAQAEIAERETAERVDPAEHGRAYPAFAEAQDEGDTDAPDDRADEEASNEEDKRVAGDARGDDAAAQARPEGQTNRIRQPEDDAGGEIPTC